MKFEPVWFDSFGAKSSCIFIETDKRILIDPGIAAMQPSFPASKEEKMQWKKEGEKEIIKMSKKADIIIISHYHHDHFMRQNMKIYENKIIFAKNPNEYINESQRKRAENFYSKIYQKFGGMELKFATKSKKEYRSPMLELRIAVNKDFGDYNDRRKYLLEKGQKWFYKMAKKWNEYEKIKEIKFDEIEIKFADGKKFRVGKTQIKFAKPMFHGIEFTRLGWVLPAVIEYEDKKLLYSSDLNGPIIEDYAEWIIKENPDIIILDGPPTYMLGYLLNRINLNRAVYNAIKILKETDAELIIYDHHLLRERKYMENTKEVWRAAKKFNKKLLTASELIGRRVILHYL